MTQSKRQARRAWAAARRKHIKRGNLYHIEIRHDPTCAIYTPARLCNCDPDRILACVENAGEYDPLELAEGAQ